ncbi:hypothetical protein CUJ84_Chr002888 [Rhizobium leguminosarum]|uniref:Uncharacterized protein n=1 Tax=Rhizobium leguminosarum TaxID=384 RepID=A0A2K9Z4T9_RHILE|nr:hypothetical protein CUJ84_Chr002888 [Rhizobium leguminosarum]
MSRPGSYTCRRTPWSATIRSGLGRCGATRHGRRSLTIQRSKAWQAISPAPTAWMKFWRSRSCISSSAWPRTARQGAILMLWSIGFALRKALSARQVRVEQLSERHDASGRARADHGTCDVADLDSLSGWLENNHTDLNDGLRLVAGDRRVGRGYHCRHSQKSPA